MNYEETAAMLDRYGWVLECFSPLEISEKDNSESRATGYAAEIVIASIKPKDDRRRRKELLKKGAYTLSPGGDV